MKPKSITNLALAMATCLTAAATFAAPPEIRNVKAFQQYPFADKVYISYEVVGDIAANTTPGILPYLVVTAKDKTDGLEYAYASSTMPGGILSGDTGIEEGLHNITWDISSLGVSVNADNVIFTVGYRDDLYMVIDLSSGANSSSYPVDYMTSPPPEGFNTDEYKTTKLVLRRIEPGVVPTRETAITRPFYCGIFEVTQRQWELVMGTRPSYFTNEAYYATRPVEQVAYNPSAYGTEITIRGYVALANEWPKSSMVGADSFMGRLRARTGFDGFDLPTEAQWEYACRAGTTTDYNNGMNYTDVASGKEAMNKLGRYVYNRVSDSQEYVDCGTSRVGRYMPNNWGLYDMHGNVYEWCLDAWSDNSLTGIDPVGPSYADSRPPRVIRGGCRSTMPDGCTSSSRTYSRSHNTSPDTGFRLVGNLSNQ